MSINNVNLSGNLTKDIEIRVTKTGKNVGKFCLAVNNGYKDKETGEWIAKPSFINCILWGDRALALQKYLIKGTKVVITGYINQSSVEENGKMSYYTNIVVDQLEMFLKPKNQEGSNENNFSSEGEDIGVGKHASEVELYQENVPF